MRELEDLVRKNILRLEPYSCARNEFTGEASVFLDANENPYNGPYNRYPDPLQTALKQKIASIKHVRPSQIMLGNGSDEPIDLIYRIFCEPMLDNVVAIDPTYGMYKVCADINDVQYRAASLTEDFEIDVEKIFAAVNNNTKAIWLCSPNNPSGNLMNPEAIEYVLERFDGIVVIDEAYIDFAGTPSWTHRLDEFPKLIVLQTFSKAWGLASVRCGMAFASEKIIALFNKVKYPYNVNLLTQRFVAEELDMLDRKEAWVKEILAQRDIMERELAALPCCERIFRTDANFILARITDADRTYDYLKNKGIIVRNRSKISLCGNCLRITIGSPEENRELMEALKRRD